MVSCESIFSSNSIFNEPEESTESTIETVENADLQISRILDLIESDNTEALIEWIYPNALEKYGREQIVERNEKIHNSIGLNSIELQDFTPINTEKDGRLAYQGTAIYETEYGTIKKQNTFNFIYHPKAGRWQLNWTPSVILPGLHDKGLVQILPLPAQRGNIYDRSGNPLAIRAYINRVGFVPSSLLESDIPAIEAAFDLSEGFINEQLELDWVKDNTFVPIKTIVELSDEQKNTIDNFHLTVEQVTTRSYPLAEAAAHLIGYVGKPTVEDLEKEENSDLTAEDYIGKAGLEAIYEDRLRGESGFKVIVTGDYQQVLLEKEAKNGSDIYLTIDSDLQKRIYDLNADNNATFTAIDPRNGDILALISTPSYNPHDFVLGINQTDYDNLIDDPNIPLYNKFADAMTPGSTEKILTSIAAFNAGTLTKNTIYNIQGKGWTYDGSWGNHQVIRYTVVDGDIDYNSAIYNSDNIYFARVALDMGLQAFNEQMANLQFGENIAADYPFGIAQLTNNGDVQDTVLLADAGYGQGELLISPTHIASIYGAVSQNGVWYRPRLLLDTEVQIITDNIASTADIQTIDNALRLVVTNTYPSVNYSNMKLAGKTGTAESGYDEINGLVKQNSWFISYDQNQRNLVLATTFFDTHLLSFNEAVNASGEIFQNIYSDGPYSVSEAIRLNASD